MRAPIARAVASRARQVGRGGEVFVWLHFALALVGCGVGAPESKGRSLSRDVVPWRSVVSADTRGVVVRDD